MLLRDFDPNNKDLNYFLIMLKWNAQKHPPSNDSGLEVFADISTHYVTDIQCAVDANVFDNNIVEKKVNNSNLLSNSMSHFTYES